MRRLGLLSIALAALACNPTLRGECHVEADCGGSLACVNGVCVSRSFAPDASSDCSPACATDQSCVAGACVNPEGVTLQVMSPEDGASLAGKPLVVTIRAMAPDAISGIEARLTARGQTVAQVRAEPMRDGYQATIDLGLTSITDGNYELLARMYRGEKKDDSAPVHLLIDKTGPVITMLPVEYPTRPDGSPATGAFLRDEQVVLDAVISDPLTGLSTDPPTLLALGMDPVVGVPQQGHLVRFSFSARSPIFKATKGLVNVKIVASDVAGNTSTVATSFQLSRHRWTWTKAGVKGTSTAPAIIGDLLVIGGDDSSVHGIRRSSGVTAWTLPSLAAAPVGHIAAGQSRVYATLADGHVLGIDPRDAAMPSGQRVQFTCPNYQPTPFLQPPLRRQVSGVAVGSTQISGSDMTQEETLFAYSADGYVQMFRKSEVPNGYGQGNGCMVEASTDAMNDSGTPAVVIQGGVTSILVGDAQGMVHNVTLGFGQQPTQFQPTFSLNSKWGFTTGGTIASSVAIGMPKDVLGLLVGSGTGLIQALDTNNGNLWITSSPVPETQGIRATPVLAGTSAYLHDQSGGLQKVALADGRFEWLQAADGPSRSTKARASPVIAEDGSFFVTGGPLAVAVDSSGRTLWTFDARSAQPSQTQLADAVSPALSCDGTLYVVATDADHAYVHALISDSTGGLATSGWPTGFHDGRNTANASTPLVGQSGACTD